ncbi:MAG: glucosaminidase domain-containing protein [Bacilli bacterium]|nr:glucosaminidase domain-containing protein [Bacilli bacterium]
MKTDSSREKFLVLQISGWLLFIICIYGANVLMKKFVLEKKVSQGEKVEVVSTTKEKRTLVVEQDTTIVEDSPKTSKRNIVYDGMTLEELSAKLDRSLNSTLSGKGYLFAKTALELGVDPYLAVAIVLEETGCKWNCSGLVKQCNNVGGQKGGTVKCNGGAYRAYPTLDEGIIGFIDNLARNYYAHGLTTPEQINPKYAASKTWASKVNNYIAKIKAA